MKKKIISIFLTFGLLLTFLPGMMVFAALDASDYQLDEGSSIEDIRQYVENGGQLYQTIRVHSLEEGLTTYRVPIPDNELEYLLDIQDGRSQAVDNPFTYTRIRYSGRSHAQNTPFFLSF